MTKSNEPWEAYEKKIRNVLLAKILHWFPSTPNGSTRVYGKRVMQGSRGDYEIDVSAEVYLENLRLLFIVECKFWESRIPQDVVLSLKSKIDDLGAHKGIVVSKKGFQKGALKVARANGIALWLYNPASSSTVFSPTMTIDSGRLRSFKDISLRDFIDIMVKSFKHIIVRHLPFEVFWPLSRNSHLGRLWLRLIRGVRYNPNSWEFRDNTFPWTLRNSTALKDLKRWILSFPIIWYIALVVGKYRYRLPDKDCITNKSIE